ncbi:MAG: hypothetical protein KJ906_02215 [Nanoarchaeota archaeon]|nr:hypothetical protein [Nanoarchaeota archaeon]
MVEDNNLIYFFEAQEKGLTLKEAYRARPSDSLIEAFRKLPEPGEDEPFPEGYRTYPLYNFNGQNLSDDAKVFEKHSEYLKRHCVGS